ncbi:MAG: trehalose-phosphatase [Phycisphaerales bacterium]|nr:trehalose-phosphatase [Hyphomonadaceae bacterium]
MHARQNTAGLSTPRAAPPPIHVRDHALFLDLDGTLIEIQDRPHAVFASPALRELLRRLSDLMSGALAVVTGRSLGDLDDILEGAVDHAAGVHGFEIQRGARITRDQIELTQLAEARADLRRLLQQHELPALVEDKHASLALHYRQIPEAEELVQSIAREIAAKRGLRVLQGKMVVELIATARTKGYAVTVLMAAPPFSGRTPVAIGDDRTDEDAFSAATRMGGFGVLVGEPRETHARYVLADPSAVAAWLQMGLRAG